jgi:hypothetical protein
VNPNKPPRWLIAAATATVAESVALFAVGPITVSRGLLGPGLAVIIAWFLLRGNRIAWIFTVFGAVLQIPFVFANNEPLWLLGISVIALYGLLVQSSRKFVWRKRSPRPFGSPLATLQRFAGQVRAGGYWAMMRLAGEISNERIVTKKLIGRLGVCVGLLFLAEGTLTLWHNHSGRSSVIVTVLWIANHTIFSIALIALFACSATAIYSAVKRRRAA